MAVTILATDLAELAGPICENTGKTSVRQAGVGGAAAAIEAAAQCPAAVGALLGGGIEAESGAGVGKIKRGKPAAGASEKLLWGGGRKVRGGREGCFNGGGSWGSK